MRTRAFRFINKPIKSGYQSTQYIDKCVACDANCIGNVEHVLVECPEYLEIKTRSGVRIPVFDIEQEKTNYIKKLVGEES